MEEVKLTLSHYEDLKKQLRKSKELIDNMQHSKTVLVVNPKQDSFDYDWLFIDDEAVEDIKKFYEKRLNDTLDLAVNSDNKLNKIPKWIRRIFKAL